MSKLLLISSLIFVTASCISINKPTPRQTVSEEPDYSEDTDYPEDTENVEWAGPGWYWGIYINNENDYWNHHNNHRNNNNRNFNGRDGNRGRGDRGGGGRGEGGGHGGGGHR